MQGLLGESCVHLIDTYDTQAGAEKAAALGNPLWGVRIDSGDIDSASRQVRKILDAHGLRAAKIMASGELTESRVEQLVDSGAPVDAFGVGTDLSTSADAPNLNAVYKLVEVDTEGIKRYTAKFSPGKFTLPGPKQIFRYPDHDLVGCSWECPGCPDNPGEAEALLRPVILNGRLVEPLPGLDAARKRAARTLPPSFRVEYSPELLALQDKCRDRVH
jgi:nicotinate phosphoribosyltransferase